MSRNLEENKQNKKLFFYVIFERESDFEKNEKKDVQKNDREEMVEEKGKVGKIKSSK